MMITRLTIFSIFVLCFIGLDSLKATHNRAGEIIYEQIDDLTIRATIITYTRTSSFSVDRDSLALYWGDGDSTIVFRVNGNGEELPNDVKKNEYVGVHTYPARGSYKLSVTDPNRIAGIQNIDFPNSVNIRFYLETSFTLLEPRFQGRNSSVILLQPPIDLACSGEVFVYNPNAYDPDGDSISYELVTPFSSEGVEVPNYELPDQIQPGENNQIFLDAITGEFRWDAPQILGEYNITYQIREWRNGTLINSMIRDMQILVRSCPDSNQPPIIESQDEICVVAGDEVVIPIISTDPDSLEVLSITATGGPFEQTDSPARLEITNRAPSLLEASVIWRTTCNHISNETYQIVVRVTDEESKPMTSLATLKTIIVRVTAPPATNPDAENENNVVTITWDEPYTCQTGNTFRGFSVWRRLGSRDIEVDTCKGGLEGLGYELVVFLTDEVEGGRYIARDAEIEPGEIYCYRIVSEFAQLTPLGNPFNDVQGIPSEEVCILSSGDVPIITHVDVTNTSEVDGSIDVRWINPAEEFVDTTILTGPYLIELEGSPDFNGGDLTSLRRFESSSFAAIRDTAFNHRSINTSDNPWSYQLTFESGSTEISTSKTASSIFATAISSDQSVVLNWEARVPWNNRSYNIYQLPDIDSPIELTADNQIIIDNLDNGVEFCFVIEGIGTYNVDGLPDSLVNRSNEVCAIPMDDVPPCPPSVLVSSICDDSSLASGAGEFTNRISWFYEGPSCLLQEDVDFFTIYFTPIGSDNASVVATLDADEFSFDHTLENSVAGCYQVTATDFLGNEGDFSEEVCLDNCPTYELPNTFTPNQDQSNDIYVPRLNRFIDRVEFDVFNRWGQKVFTTEDPQINWNGENMSGKELSEGTYYYTCAVFEIGADDLLSSDILRGTIQIVR